jgi:hypothetical protein
VPTINSEQRTTTEQQPRKLQLRTEWRKIPHKKTGFDRPFLLPAIALIGLVMLASPLPAFSQGCALCYTSAASAGNRMIQALQSGILILVLPPTLMSVAMIFIVYHKRNQFRPDNAPDSDDKW